MKKTVNYTTIRKQIPSFERSVDSNSSIKVLRFPCVETNTDSSQSGSIIMFGNAQSKPKRKSDNFANKIMKDSKIIRLTKDLRPGVKKQAKPK